MPVTTPKIYGGFALPDGVAIASAKVSFKLSAMDTENSIVLIPFGVKTYTLIDGELPADAVLWRNSEGTNGTFYTVVLTVTDVNGKETVYIIGKIQLTGTDDEYDVTLLLIASAVIVAGNIYTVVDAVEYEALSAAILATADDRARAETAAGEASVSAGTAANSAALVDLGALNTAVSLAQAVHPANAWYSVTNETNLDNWFAASVARETSWLDRRINTERPAIPSVHLPDVWSQLAVNIPAQKEDETAFTKKVIWSSRTPSDYLPIERKSDRYAQTQDIYGNAALLDTSYAPADQTANVNVWDILIFMGQSLSVEESGPGAGSLRNWPAFLEYPVAAPSTRMKMLKTTIQNTNGDPPYYMTAGTLNAAKDNFPGGIDATTGLHYSSTRGRLLAAINYLEGYMSPCDGRTLVVGGLSRGGKSIKYFLPSSAGGIAEGGLYFWNEAIIPYLTRMAVEAAAQPVATTIGRVSVIWTHHEYEHGIGATKAEYRADLDALASNLKAAVVAQIGAGAAFYMVSTHGARIYETTHSSIPVGSAIGEVSQTVMAIYEKGISADSADAEFTCAPPNYDLSWSGSISHLVGEAQGYVQLFARGIYTLMQSIRAREAGQAKPKPSGPDWAAGYWTEGKTIYRIPVTIRNGNGIWERDARGDATRFNGIPPKPSDGFSFYGDLPAIVSVEFDQVACEFVFTFAAAYSGTTGKIGVAYAVPDTAQFLGCWQGWRTLSQNPTDEWVHRGIGANWRVSQGEVCPLTGRDLYHYPHPYIASVAA